MARLLTFISSHRTWFISLFAIGYPLVAIAFIGAIPRAAELYININRDSIRIGLVTAFVVCFGPVFCLFYLLPIRPRSKLVKWILLISLVYLPSMAFVTAVFAMKIWGYVDPHHVPL